MDIIIYGAGVVGRHVAEVLSGAGHNLTVLDLNPDRLAELQEVLDVRTYVGNGAQADVLLEVGCAGADLYIGATNYDEVNLLACSVAKGVGAEMTIARVHHSGFFEQRGFNYTSHLGVDHLVCPEFTTAQTIASVLRSPGALAIEQFARGKVELQRLPVDDDAEVIGTPLRELKMPGRALLTMIERGGKPLFPGADTVIEKDDVVTLIGDAEGFDKIRQVFQTEPVHRRRIMVMGGTTLGVWLCRALRHRSFSVRMFEADEKRALELAEKLDWITMLNVDAIRTDALREERVDQADAFVALTDDEETNILAAAQAKSMGVKLSIAVLERPTYLHLLEHIGIDRAFSPRATAAQEILRRLEPGPVRRLATLADDFADVFEVRVPETATKVINKPLRELQFPARCIIAAIQSGDEVFVPTADSVIRAGDTVVAVAPAGGLRKLNRTFGGR